MVYLLKMGIFHGYVSHNPMVAYALVYYNLTSIFLQCPTLLGWNESYQISTWYGIRICRIQSQVSSHYDIACRCFLPNRFHEAQGPQAPDVIVKFQVPPGSPYPAQSQRSKERYANDHAERECTRSILVCKLHDISIYIMILHYITFICI